MNKQPKVERKIIRIGKHLREFTTIWDSAGNLLHKSIKPVMLEFYPRDVIQIIVGASILAVPVSFTEEVWKLGAELPGKNIFYLFIVSLLFICSFVYYNFYRGHFSKHWLEFLKRVLSIYILSMLVAGVILFIIGQAPLGVDWLITLKRMVIISFPASMSAAVADMIK